MSLQEFTEKRIFAPLSMTRTHFHDDHQHAVEDRAYSYAPADGGGFQKSVLSYAHAGATSLFTTAEDLARWLDNFRHERVGGPEVMALMKTRGTLNNGETIYCAHGLIIGEYRGLTTIGHGGGDEGFVAQVVWFQDANTGVVVLTNVANNALGKALQVANLVLADVLDAEAGELSTVETSPEALERVPGRFLGSIGLVSIEESQGALLLRFPQGQPQPLAATGERSFRVRGQAVTLEFEADWNSYSVRLFGTVIGSGTRLDNFAPSPGELAELEGTYYSPEVEALYRIEATGDELPAHHSGFHF